MMTHTGFPLYGSRVFALYMVEYNGDNRAWDVSLL